jgi:phthalate 4,5-cis-dihydrodiol dehydrogenase
MKLGIAGLGLGALFALPWMRRDPRFELVAAADPRPEAGEQFAHAYGGTAYDSVERMCDDPAVELVYVATPHYMHAEHALTAIERGKHVLIEKPLARSVEEAEAIVAAAERAGVQALYGHSHALDPAIQEMGRLVRSGEVGPLGFVLSFNYNDVLYRPRAEWELDPARSGGTPFIQGAHQVDIVRSIAGSRMTSVQGWSAVLDPARRVPGAHQATLTFESGAAATVVFSGHGHFDSAEWIDWAGESGAPRDPETHRRTHTAYLERDGAQEAEARDGRRFGAGELPTAVEPDLMENFGVTIASCAGADLRSTGSGLVIESGRERTTVDLPASSGRQLLLDEVHAAVVDGVPAQIDARWALDTVRACEAMA